MALNALYVGSSGLNADSTALDVIGNNLANINTTGYKGQRMLFKDVVYQTLNPGSGASTNIGGRLIASVASRAPRNPSFR